MNSYKKEKLNNGLRLVTIPIKGANSVTVLILVGTGSKYETKDINGISHFLEHMFFKGTEKRPSTLKISETLDKVGGEYNAYTSKEITGFWAKVDKKHLDVALDWISDMFLNSKFEEEEIQREKGVIIEEVNMYLDTPTAYVGELWDQLLYKDQPAGWRIIGEKENILSFDRNKIIEYFKNHYSFDNTVICIAGDVNQKEIKTKVEEYFKEGEKMGNLPKEKVKEFQEKPELLLHYKKTDQTHFCLGVRAYDLFHEQRYALNLLSVILGGNMSSRLFTSVRERNGLAYYIHTSTEAMTDTGYLVTQAGVDHKNFEKAVELIIKEYKSIKENGVSEQELQNAKDYIKGSTTLSLESSDHMASFYGAQEILENNILTPEEKFERIDKVSVNDIKKIAGEIFLEEKLNLALIGPFEEEEKEKLQILLKI